MFLLLFIDVVDGRCVVDVDLLMLSSVIVDVVIVVALLALAVGVLPSSLLHLWPLLSTFLAFMAM